MPKRGMHVYAPGANNYRVISLNIAPQPHVRTMPLRYPPSEIYNFAPLNERVPVFQKPFTLLMDVIPEATAEARKAFAGRKELVISGTLEYQACDDKLCYNPVSLPLSWTVALQGLVPGAPPPAQRSSSHKAQVTNPSHNVGSSVFATCDLICALTQQR
jgi:hypothetical protein